MLDNNDNPNEESPVDTEAKDNSTQVHAQTDVKEILQELERKDLVIQNLQSQLASKPQNAQINSLNEVNKLREKIETQSQIIREKESLIDSLNKKLGETNQDNIFLRSQISTVKTQIKDLQTQIESAKLQNNYKASEQDRNLMNMQSLLESSSKEKATIESKANQLVQLVKQYSSELNNANIKIKTIEAEKESLAHLNKRLNEQHSKMNSEYLPLKEKEKSFNELKLCTCALHDNVSQLTSRNADLQAQINQLLRNKEEQSQQINILKAEISELESYKKSFDSKASENLMIKNELCELNERTKLLRKRVDESEGALTHMTVDINKNIVALAEWVDAYFAVRVDDVCIPALPKLVHCHNIRLDLLAAVLDKKAKKLNEKISFDDRQIEDFKNDNRNLLTKIDELNFVLANKTNENLVNKEDVMKLKSEIETLNIFIEKLRVAAINSEKDKICLAKKIDNINQEKLEITSALLKKNEENFNLNQSFDMLNKHQELSTKQLRDELVNLKNENMQLQSQNATLKQENLTMHSEYQTQINNTLNNLNEEISNKLQDEKNKNDQMLQDFNSKITNFENENRNLKYTVELLDKKLKDSQYQLELKERQILNQEEIINRRQSNANYLQENVDGQIELIKNLQNERSKLISDNIALINDNNSLKENVRTLTAQLSALATPQTTNGNYSTYMYSQSTKKN